MVSGSATMNLPFEQRACFIAGQAKSGTTLLVALLDGHPELLVLPEETAYFPTVLTKYAPRGRRAQFDYLTKQSLSNVLFGGPCKWGKRSYATFPREKFLQTFERAAFDPANAEEDLLVLMVKAYAATLQRPLDTIRCWVEKTPANRNHVPAILDRKSTRLNSSHVEISYAVFCLKKKKNIHNYIRMNSAKIPRRPLHAKILLLHPNY